MPPTGLFGRPWPFPLTFTSGLHDSRLLAADLVHILLDVVTLSWSRLIRLDINLRIARGHGLWTESLLLLSLSMSAFYQFLVSLLFL